MAAACFPHELGKPKERDRMWNTYGADYRKQRWKISSGHESLFGDEILALTPWSLQ